MNNCILTVKELCNYLNCSESTIRKLIRESNIPYFKVSTKILFKQSEIDNWIVQNSNC